RPQDVESQAMLRAAELATAPSTVEVGLTAFEAGRVHPWWRAQASLRVRLTDSWLVGGGAEHLWRDFQPRGADRAPAGLPSGYVRDTLFFAEATWKPPTSPWSLYLYGGGSPQAAFT